MCSVVRTISITPGGEVSAYARLSVPLASGTYEVAVTKYRTRKEGRSNEAGGSTEGELFKDRLVEASDHAILQELSRTELVRVFTGKAPRSAIVSVLRWIDQCNLLDPTLDKRTGLQKICDYYCGLDCNGFVGNWANDNQVTAIDPVTVPYEMGWPFAGWKRQSLQEIQPYDIIVWHGHVAAVHSLNPVDEARPWIRTAQVAEAYNHGIACEERTLSATGQAGLFDVSGHGFGSAEVFGIGLERLGEGHVRLDRDRPRPWPPMS